MQHLNNYTLARGKVYLGRETTFDQFSQVGEVYTGNSPGFVVNNEAQALDHYSSDGGINELDASATMQVNRGGTLTFDDISGDNLAMYFLGTKATIAQSAGAFTETISGVLQGQFYQLGVSETNPQGVKSLSAVVVKTGATTHAEGDDYEIDTLTGRLYIVPGGAIAGGTSIDVEATKAATSYERVISGSKPVKGRLRYIEDNPAGKNRNFLFPLVELAPNGDFDLKGESWRQMTFSLRVLKRGNLAAIYIDGQPVA